LNRQIEPAAASVNSVPFRVPELPRTPPVDLRSKFARTQLTE
jgi:hypothetical protein